MAREDIVAGLKNAVERGYPLEKAKHSFISAGYPREEVEKAAKFIHSGSVYAPRGEKLPMPKVQPSRKQTAGEPGKIKRNMKIILLVIVLLLLVGILIATIIFKEELLSLFT